MGLQTYTIRTRRTAADQLLGAAALALLAVVLVALWRGRAHWHEVPWAVWGHLATIVPALALTPVMLGRGKGDRAHRQLGYLWIGLLVLTALISFDIRQIRHGGFSPIHLLSVFVLFTCWSIVDAARKHRIEAHRRRVHALVIGALLTAGFFTLPFGRMLGVWLAGG